MVAAYDKSCGLSCAPQKTELLLVSPRKTHPPGSPTITLRLEGHIIAPSPSVKILAMILQADHSNTLLIKLKTTTNQVTHMIRRVTTKIRGMGEADMLRLVQAFVVSRITYAVPYALLKATELEKINILIRKAYKQDMGLPASTSTARLLRLGIHNSAEELIEGHLSSQQLRLGATKTGRFILPRLALSASLSHPPLLTGNVPHSTRQHLIVPALPCNMHPVHNEVAEKPDPGQYLGCKEMHHLPPTRTQPVTPEEQPWQPP